MDNCFKEFRKKELVSITEGFKIGYVDDFAIDIETATITHLIVNKKGKIFGNMTKDNAVLIPWTDVKVIGQDAILVEIDNLPRYKKSFSVKSFLKELFN